MSTYSLPRFINGGGPSNNIKPNLKYGTLPLSVRAVAPLRTNRRSSLNRNGSIKHNQFRGIKKDLLEKQTNMIIHSMTVRITLLGFEYIFNRFFFSWFVFYSWRSCTKKFCLKYFIMLDVKLRLDRLLCSRMFRMLLR